MKTILTTILIVVLLATIVGLSFYFGERSRQLRECTFMLESVMPSAGTWQCSRQDDQTIICRIPARSAR